MNVENDRKYIRIKKVNILVLVLIVGAGVLGWQLGRSDNPIDSRQPADSTIQPDAADTANVPGIKSLISYALPDGWKEASCPAAAGSVFIIPSGGPGLDCNANPSAPVKMSVDPGSTKDCNELQNVRDVKKHICISLFINGLRSLKATTEYLPSSSYKKAMTLQAYYVDTGKEVVRVDYAYGSDNRSQTSFDQLANSIEKKP